MEFRQPLGVRRLWDAVRDVIALSGTTFRNQLRYTFKNSNIMGDASTGCIWGPNNLYPAVNI